MSRTYKEHVAYFLSKYTNKSNFNIIEPTQLVFPKVNNIRRLVDPFIEFDVGGVIDIASFGNHVITIDEHLDIIIYEIVSSKLTFLKRIEYSPLSYYYSCLKGEMKYYVLVFYLSIIDKFKYEAYFEAFLNFINIEKVNKCRILNDSLILLYRDKTMKRVVNKNETIIIEDLDSDFQFPKTSRLKREDVVFNKTSITLKHSNNSIVDKKVIPKSDYYFIADRKSVV